MFILTYNHESESKKRTMQELLTSNNERSWCRCTVLSMVKYVASPLNCRFLKSVMFIDCQLNFLLVTGIKI